ncbi:MAG: penicillin-insensitive murein endopeptidase [Gemmatimonadaceae bacterium]|nr:penicillin-insensitive murein endopeptidase [Acetobacteraceae bacterium]
MRLAVPMLVAWLSALAVASAQPAPRIVGGPGGGCIAGAVELPSDGPGYKTIRASRSWFWGHPDTVAALQLLGVRARAAGLPTLYVNDLSRPRGGPMVGVHSTHMLGLDADVWLDLEPKTATSAAERDAVEAASLVTPDGRGVQPGQWSVQHVTLLRLAAGLPGVDRILVNPAIKRQLCQTVQGDRGWLRTIRPWYGHGAHMHIHFRCPAGQDECRDQSPVPPGDGCDGSLDWWFAQLDLPPAPPAPPRKPPILPAACAGILAGQP